MPLRAKDKESHNVYGSFGNSSSIVLCIEFLHLYAYSDRPVYGNLYLYESRADTVRVRFVILISKTWRG